MVAFGGFLQFKVQKNAEKNFSSGKILVHKKLKKSLKVDVVLGIILLGVVALLTNGTLPAGEIQKKLFTVLKQLNLLKIQNLTLISHHFLVAQMQF
jgi:hypothetical protein